VLDTDPLRHLRRALVTFLVSTLGHLITELVTNLDMDVVWIVSDRTLPRLHGEPAEMALGATPSADVRDLLTGALATAGGPKETLDPDTGRRHTVQ
jgi:hypothetical protein